MARKKPLPTRRSRGRTEDAAAGEAGGDETAAMAGTDEGAEADAAAASEAGSAAGLEMALIVITMISLVAAFLLIQVKMKSAFGETWPI